MDCEYNRTEPRRRLTMTYTIRAEYVVAVGVGPGSVARAIEECSRALIGTPNVDAESIRFTLSDM